MRRVVAVALSLAACQRGEPAAQPTGAGAALEQAAVAAGMVADPGAVVPTGVFATDNDRVCVVPVARGYRIGASVDYGAGQRCIARGTANGRGELAIDFGGDCRFSARVDGDRIVFPAVLPGGCDTRCEGRASLAALQAVRLSNAAAEAARTRGADDALLCEG